jgi:hypothetical protein
MQNDFKNTAAAGRVSQLPPVRRILVVLLSGPGISCGNTYNLQTCFQSKSLDVFLNITHKDRPV